MQIMLNIPTRCLYVSPLHVITNAQIVPVYTKYSAPNLRCRYIADVAGNLLAIGLRLDVRIACNGLQQKFQHAEYFTCDPLIFQQIHMQF